MARSHKFKLVTPDLIRGLNKMLIIQIPDRRYAPSGMTDWMMEGRGRKRTPDRGAWPTPTTPILPLNPFEDFVRMTAERSRGVARSHNTDPSLESLRRFRQDDGREIAGRGPLPHTVPSLESLRSIRQDDGIIIPSRLASG